MPDSFIVAASETVTIDGQIVPPTKYSLDCLRGYLVFSEFFSTDSFNISYRYIDLRIPAYVQHRVPQGSGGHIYKPTPQKNLGMFPEGSRLMHSGSLLRGIKIGSRRDATMESAFQLEAYGGIGENVEIVAVLSDQDLPIQPEGTSEKIAQLDQVYIGVTGPHFAATFGDFTAEFAPKSEFTNYTRRLSGVQVEGLSEPASADVVGAVLEGIWATDEFYGSEGNQGPYSLSADGKTGIQILAGTETVWLDGEKLKRGQNNDYTIDYNLGQITFTQNRPIGAQSRITVDFQYTDLEFRRSFYGVSGELKPLEAVRFHFTGMSESDDPDNPLATEFDDEELAALASAGDYADSAYVWGAELSDSGSYELADSATDSAHFEWVGEGEGTWDVSFTDVGSGNGEYDYVASGQYEWVGSGKGRYTPRRLLPMPASHAVLGVGLEFAPLGGVTLSTEMAASNLDRNRLSEIADDDNSGNAYNLVLTANKPISVSNLNLGNTQLSARYRRKESRFTAIGRLDDAEFNRDWGIEDASGEEELAEIQVRYSPIQPLSISGSYGANRRGESRSKRVTSALNFSKSNWRSDFNFSRTETDSRWDRLWGGVSGGVWWLTPAVSTRYEDNDKSGGFRFWESSAELGISPLPWLAITPGFERREDDTRDSTGIVPQSQTTAYKLYAKLGKWDFRLYHREYKALTEDENDIVTDLANLNGSFRITRPDVNGRIRYELSKERSEVLEPYYTYVGDGAGNYEFDEDRGEYIPLVGGDYLKQYRSTGEFTPVVSSNLRASAGIRFKDIGGEGIVQKILRQLSFDGLVQSEGETEAFGAKSLLLDPREMNDDEELMTGQFLAEGNLKLGSNFSRNITLRGRYSKYRNTQYTTGEEQRWTDSRSIEGKNSFGTIGNWRGKVEWSRQARLYPGSSYTGTDLSGTELSLLWTKSVGEKLQLSFEVSYLAQTDDWPDEAVSIDRFAFAPGGTYFIKQGTVRATAQYSRVSTKGENVGILPYEMAHGDWLGDNGSIILMVNINIASGTLLTVTYDLESHTGRLPEHTAEAKVRLTF